MLVDKLPKPHRHIFTLRDGRQLAYYTFDTTNLYQEGGQPDLASNPHPVLFLHGFPGSGVEGALCATAVAKAGGLLYAVDRPGMGHSDPPLLMKKEWDADDHVESFCRDIQEWVASQKWSSYSIIGFSGGGPFSLALLEYYLRQQQHKPEPAAADLFAVSIVAGVYCAAGTNEMMAMNQQLYNAITDYPRSWLVRIFLQVMILVMQFVCRILPKSWLIQVITNTRDLPEIDQAALRDPMLASTMADDLPLALRQGTEGPIREARVLFRDHQKFEAPLIKFYSQDTTTDAGSTTTLPRVFLFQGGMDKNVPASHTRCVHEKLLGKRSKLTEYAEMGHISLAVQKVDDYVKAVIPSYVKAVIPSLKQ